MDKEKNMKQFKSFAKRVATVFLAIAIICTSTSFEQLSAVAAETEDLVQVAAGEEAVQLAAITPEAPIVEVPATIETQSEENTVAPAVPSDETPAADAQVLPISPSDEAPVVETPAVSENEVVVEIPDGTTLVYKVAFVGFEGADLGTIEVEEGQAAVSPEAPVVEGYTFTGWDADFTAVTSDITVNAIYEATVVKTFVVTFVGMEDTILGTADVVEGGTVAEENIPAEPVVEGYTFTGWDKDFSVVAEDMTVKAVFEESYPEFNGSVTIDGVTISAHADKGVIEAGANLSAELVALTDAQEEKIDEVSSFEEDTVKYGFDINIIAKDGTKLQPVFGEDVQITFSNAVALDGVEATTEAEVVYVADDASTAEVKASTEESSGDIAFDAEHFSIYVYVANQYRNYLYENPYFIHSNGGFKSLNVNDQNNIFENGSITFANWNNNVTTQNVSLNILEKNAFGKNWEYSGNAYYYDGHLNPSGTREEWIDRSKTKLISYFYFNTSGHLYARLVDGSNRLIYNFFDYNDNRIIWIYEEVAPTYTIEYLNLNGGTVSPANLTNYKQASPAITLTNPIRAGYTFTGWTGSNGTTAQTTVTIPAGSTGNRTYTANWVPTNYTITYNLNSGSVITVNPIVYNVETSSFILNNPSKPNYTFAGWTGSNGTTAQTTVTITRGSTGNKNYVANWVPTNYAITYSLNSGTITTVNPTAYNVETASFTLNNPSKSGNIFAGWTGSNGAIAQTTVTIPTGSTGDKTYTANWTKEIYDVKFNYKNDSNVFNSTTLKIEFENKSIVPSIPNLVGNETTYFTFRGWDDKSTPTEENYSNSDINNLLIKKAYIFEAKYNEQPKMVQFFVAKEEGSRESSYSSNDFDAALTTKGTIKEYVGVELNSGYLEKVDYNSDDLKNDIAIAYPGYVIVWDRMVKRSDGYHIDGYKVANQSFTASAVGYDGSYTGTSHQITVTAPTEKYNKIYYSTTVLTSTNYSTAGSETNISVTNVTSSPVTVYYYVKAKDGYNDVTGSATITIAPAIITITALPTSKYFDVAEDPTLGYTVGDTQNNEVASFTGTLSRAIGVTAQTYAISQGTLNLADNGTFKAGNYEISFIGADFTIKTKSIAGEGISITGITDRTYNGLQQTQTFEVKDETTKLIEGLTADYAISYGNNTNAGTASVTITGQGNYIGSSKTVTFKINPAKLSVSANALTKTYGENKYYSQKDLTYTVGSAQNGEQPKFGGMLNRAEGFFGDEVGTYPIYYKYGAGKGNQSLYLVDNESFKASNYEIVYTGSNLTVTPATITINIANTSKTVGSADPTFTATVSGNLLPEDMGQDLTYTLSRTSGENVGIYPIDASDIKALREIFMSSFATQSAPIDEGVELPEFPGDNNAIGNYTIIVNKGTLTINAAPTPTDDGQEPTPTTPTTTPTTTITPGITATAATLAPSVVTFEEAPVALAARLRTVTPVEATVEEETPAMEADDVVIADENTALADEVTEIAEEETPLAVPVDNCPIHWLILILTAAYAIFEIVRGFARKKKIDELTEGESINKSDAKA